MKHFVVAAFIAATASSAFAADMPMKAPPAIAPLFNWSGFYIGATAGYAWNGDPHLRSDVVTSVDMPIKGGVFGGLMGLNWQVGNVVYGIETDLQNGPRGSAPTGSVGPGITCASGPCMTDINYYGTVRGRFGIAYNQWLLFGTGGFAYGQIKAGIDNSVFQGEGIRAGWVAGAGIEYALSPNLSAKIEWQHVDFGTVGAGPGGTGSPLFAEPVRFDVVRAGLNWKFGD